MCSLNPIHLGHIIYDTWGKKNIGKQHLKSHKNSFEKKSMELDIEKKTVKPVNRDNNFYKLKFFIKYI